MSLPLRRRWMAICWGRGSTVHGKRGSTFTVSVVAMVKSARGHTFFCAHVAGIFSCWHVRVWFLVHACSYSILTVFAV